MTTNSNIKPAVLFVHGGYVDSSVWRHWERVIEELGIEAHTLDLRGHSGKFPWRVGKFGRTSLYDYAEDVIQKIDSIGRSVYLIGHSMGGLVCQIVAANNPSKVKGLVLVASAAPSGISIVDEGTNYLKVLGLIAAMFTKTSHTLSVSTLTVSGNDIHRRPESGTALMEMARSKIDIESIECRVLVLGAREDTTIPLKVQKEIAAKYDAQYKEFTGSHNLMLEANWRESIRFVAEWILELA